ncbi:MAG: hypothetical protein MK135_01170 [Polyangiaceae bacterium]|nr:hypothetical protein [Polyangiaceae bacterium]
MAESQCIGGWDDDNDGFSDCRDRDCNGQFFCEFGRELSCNDNIDNDGDGAEDCFDADCVGSTSCETVDETRCSDGIDNNANGAIDCADSNCAQESYCEASETRCDDGIDNDVDGQSDCADPQCSTAAHCESGSEASCDDGRDNDGNGSIDCRDVSCNGQDNCEYGAERSCDDGIDNDADGLGDCDDPDCLNQASCPTGSEPECQAPAPSCELLGEVSCSDGRDNDGDLLIDCADADCSSSAGCELAGETTCDDNLDNDLDGWVDCLDPDCFGLAGPQGSCSGRIENDCDDGADNDNDQLVDCADADCDQKNGPDYLCNYRFETSCTDGENNDGDAAGADCLDLDCVGASHLGMTACPSDAVSGDCLCEYEIETDCDDGFDNDGDGQVDCDDDQCQASCNQGTGGNGGGGGGTGGGPSDFCDGGPLIVSDGGTDRCSGDIAESAFRFALCACSASVNSRITTDSFDSDAGAYGGSNIGTDGSMGVNGNLNMSGRALSIGGSLWGGSDMSTTGTTTVAEDLYVYQDWESGSNVTIEGDGLMGGSFKGNSSTPTVGGTWNPNWSSVPSDGPCDCGANTFDIGAMISAASNSSYNNNDLLTATQINTLNVPGNNGAVTLDCGKYYINKIGNGADTLDLTLNAPVALFVAGNLQVKTLRVYFATASATLDLFVGGGVTTQNGGSFSLGSATAPWRSRLYVDGSTFNLQGTSNIAGNIYAPNATYTTSNQSQTIYGAISVDLLNSNGPLTMHYDEAIQQAGDECVVEPPPDEHECSSCRHCANQACYDSDADNLRECSSCRTNADCCAPLVCNGSGVCVTPGSF